MGAVFSYSIWRTYLGIRGESFQSLMGAVFSYSSPWMVEYEIFGGFNP